MNGPRRKPTATTAFGSGRRESHDATAFYARFTQPELSDDETVVRHDPVEPLVVGDARSMGGLADASVALVVTSPPYFAGKDYEADLGRHGVPASYAEYLALLRDVFAECRAKLEPGGRMAVNVANLGRKPYRSLSADVVSILQDDLGLLLRGEIVWRKARGASGSCAFGTFRSPRNPVLRDVTERVIVAGKGRFDRALDPERRRAADLPWRATSGADEFLAATLDLWELAPEQARNVGHPAPFPVELPERLIELYTFADDLVLDPFVGSGSTAVAAVRTGRRFAGYDTDPAYIHLARSRVAAEPTLRPAPDGAALGAVADQVLADAGFTSIRRDVAVRGMGIRLARVALDQKGREWSFDLTGARTASPAGLARHEVAMAAIGRAALVRAAGRGPLVLMTSHLPSPGSAPAKALRAAGHDLVADALVVPSAAATERLAAIAAGGVGRGFELLPSP